MSRCASQIRVTNGIDGTIQTRPLAVPHGENPIVAGIRGQGGLLGTPTGRRRKVLVDGGMKMNVSTCEKTFAPPQFFVHIVHRGATVARDVTRGIEARGLVPAELVHCQPKQRLSSGQVDRSGILSVLVSERDIRKGHAGFLPSELIGTWRSLRQGFIASPGIPVLPDPFRCEGRGDSLQEAIVPFPSGEAPPGVRIGARERPISAGTSVCRHVLPESVIRIVVDREPEQVSHGHRYHIRKLPAMDAGRKPGAIANRATTKSIWNDEKHK